MPPAAPALLPLCRLGGWTDGGGGDSKLEEFSQSPGHQVEATLLKDVCIRQVYDCGHFGARHPPLHTGILGAGAPDQCAAVTVGGWRRAKPIQVSTPDITLPTHPPPDTPIPRIHPPTTTNHHRQIVQTA